jgi:flagellar M-ring protein FliF
MATPETNSFGQALGQASAFVKSLNTRQKFLLGGGGVIVLVTLLVFVKLLGKPEMKPLYTGMIAADAQTLAAKLALRKIPYEISSDGSSISVPAEQLDAARLEIAAEGKPRSGRMGFELFDKQNWAGSDFSEKVNYQRALEGELERTIQTMDGVENVRVHLALPSDSIFSGSEREAKASVILSMRGSRITRQTENAVARLVAGAVEKLAPEDVAVIDADTNNALAKDAGGGMDANGRSLETALSERLVQTLEPVAGLGRVRASVRLEYDLTSSEEQEETFDPNQTTPLSMQRTEEHSSTAAGGIAGTSSNLPGSSPAAKSSPPDNPTSRSENGTYAVSKLVRHTVVPAGRIKRLAAAVLVDDAVEAKIEAGRMTEVRHHRSSEQLEQIEELAKAAIGADDSRGDVVTVQNIGFQQPVREAPAHLTLLKRVQNAVREWGQAIRFAAIGLLFLAIYAAVLRPVKKQMVEALKSVGSRISAPGRAGDAKARAAAADAAAASELPDAAPEVKQLGALKKQIVEKVKAEPLPTTRLVQTWIREGNEG